MKHDKTTFALFFGNRGLFPASLIASARDEMTRALDTQGHTTLLLDAGATRHGGVETVAEGRRYARFLEEHRGRFGGVIVCLPNFGDENGAVAALQDAGVPVLIQAYPDELDKMAPALRRDAFCGKFSIMDVFCQHGIRFTALPPHVASPASPGFAAQVDHFDRVCRTVRGVRRMTVVAVGARTTAFKTVRIDELALAQHGINVETLDLSGVFARVRKLASGDAALKAKAALLEKYASFHGVPAAAFDKLARLGVVLDQIVEEFGASAMAVRCWLEMQQELGISPCVLMSELNERGVPAACEVDVGSALTMYALQLASGAPAACLDWNNNYGDALDKCILFHCGPVPQAMMRGKGRVTDHDILANATGPGCGYGCNTGRIAPGPFTFSNVLTSGGTLSFYLGQGAFTDDPLPADYFGCAGVAEINGLQTVLQKIGYLGHRHHVTATPGHVAAPLEEALRKYLGFELTLV
ncbi:MAG: hypothetical protein NTW87_13955 [Planctomycetota bacterium]|nr:hypothetical protein [Planctomycetota bacterium]